MKITPTNKEAKLKEAKDWGTNLPAWATMTADEAAQHIEDNVTNLASAKVVLKKIARGFVYLRDRADA
tara:strand:- start:9064 stop:9267 length:204 start_codon:yes stop_codon:yes gene_type:complete